MLLQELAGFSIVPTSVVADSVVGSDGSVAVGDSVGCGWVDVGAVVSANILEFKSTTLYSS